MNFINQHRLEALGMIIGTVSGFAYWYFAGCSTGSCAITSNPLYSSIYGALAGVFIFGIFKKEKTKTQ